MSLLPLSSLSLLKHPFNNLRETHIIVSLWRLCVTGLIFSFQAAGEGEAVAQEGESMEAEES